MKIDFNNIKPKPFLRWAGGKRWLTSKIISLIPDKVNNYYEPFLGGGSIFFNTNGKFNKYYLSDLNNELIITYNQIKVNVEQLIKNLSKYINEEKYYYRVRDKLFKTDCQSSARFIYLNRTCFNGLYRVNKNGDFNVPFGYRNLDNIVDKENLLIISKYLNKAIIRNYDFEIALEKCVKNDFIYIDPPYTVAHSNNGFISYNKKLFSWDDQVRLSEIFRKLDRKGCYIIVSNADHLSIRKLYKGYKIERLERVTTVSGLSKSRKSIQELIIKNF